MATVVIDRRFNGPEHSSNGGYACGGVAAFIDGPAEVTLRVPPPLDTEMAIERAADGRVTMLDGEVLVAEGRPAEVAPLEPPARPSLAEATDASSRHPGRGVRHALSDCFVCGPERVDGLRVSAGPLATDPLVGSAPFVPGDDLPSAAGALAPELVWSVLDCPSYVPRMWALDAMCLLGRLGAALHRPVRIGEPLVGWELGTEGRKHSTASALIDEAGEVVAEARATWIEPR